MSEGERERASKCCRKWNVAFCLGGPRRPDRIPQLHIFTTPSVIVGKPWLSGKMFPGFSQWIVLPYQLVF